jgi:hypothetical protein
MKKFYYVRRNDTVFNGSIVEIPESHLAMTLRVNPTWQVMEETTNESVEPIIPTAPKQPSFHCPICGLESASEHGLKVHKARKHG